MTIIDYDFLVWRMSLWEEQAFVEFDEAMRDLLVEWLRGFGLSDPAIAIECPRCLLELGILVVSRRGEIAPGHLLTWCHTTLRSLVVRYWREAESTSGPVPVLTAARVRIQTDRIDGSVAVYDLVAKRLKISSKWLKWRHRALQQ